MALLMSAPLPAAAEDLVAWEAAANSVVDVVRRDEDYEVFNDGPGDSERDFPDYWDEGGYWKCEKYTLGDDDDDSRYDYTTYDPRVVLVVGCPASASARGDSCASPAWRGRRRAGVGGPRGQRRARRRHRRR